jgi:HEAT repeat protein
LSDQRGVPLLTELARTHPQIDVRREAIETLGDLASGHDKDQPNSDRSTIVDLLTALAKSDPETDVQNEAIETLGGLPNGDGVTALVELARDHPDANVRKRALEALLESDHPRARELFQRALRKSPTGK